MEALLADVVCQDPAVQTEAFASCLRVLCEVGASRCSGDADTNEGFPNDVYLQLLSAAFDPAVPPAPAFVFDALLRKAFKKYLDLRFYGMRNVRRIAERAGSVLGGRLFDFAASIQCPTADELSNLRVLVELPSGASPHYHNISHVRGEFSSMWSLILPIVPPAKHEAFLAILDSRILPHVYDPENYVSFLTDAYRSGGVVGVLALNGLFTLVRQHNVNVPDFYDHLYALIDSSAFTAPHRVMLMKALGRCMSSTMIPAYVVAAVLKRTARTLLAAPPSALVWGLPFMYNLLKRFPACRVMIHRESGAGAAALVSDVYDERTPLTAECRAIESCLWELQALESHYWARIARILQMFHDRFTKPEFDLDDIADSVEQVDCCDAAVEELSHLWSKRPPTVFEIPASLF